MKILLAVDYSESSRICLQALEKICIGVCEIHCLQVLQPLSPANTIELTDVVSARESLERTAEDLTKRFSTCQIFSDVEIGDPATVILRVADRLKPDLLVMGTHSRDVLDTLFLGSVSRKVLAHARCCVRLIKKTAREVNHSFNVLIATNDCFESDYAFDEVLEMSWPADTVFRCISVVKACDDVSDFEQAKLSASSWLECCRVRLSVRLSPSAVSSELIAGDAREVIVHEALRWPADLILVGARAQNIVEKLVHGSVSESVAVHAPCSVQVLPLRKKENLSPA